MHTPDARHGKAAVAQVPREQPASPWRSEEDNWEGEALAKEEEETGDDEEELHESSVFIFAALGLETPPGQSAFKTDVGGRPRDSTAGTFDEAPKGTPQTPGAIGGEGGLLPPLQQQQQQQPGLSNGKLLGSTSCSTSQMR
eukprot:GHVT01016206.1.p1 GENE.GHVT01016206.1~~GHVT01016206.1.p1  ORF type:complete len:141 (-),score=47.89 GHVT01016206.1:468-890(-)